MLILTGCHITPESSLLIHVESSGIITWYIGRSLARLFLMTSMFFYSSFLISYQSIFMLMKVILAVMCTTYLGSSENKA